MAGKASVHVERIPSKDLAKTSKLQPLWEFANYAFDDNMAKYPELGFTEGKRFEQPQDFEEEMGPTGVTFIQYASISPQPEGSDRIIATAGCKPWSSVLMLDERVERMRKEREAREKSTPKGQELSANSFYTKEHEDQLVQQLEKVGPMVHNDGQDDVPRWEVMTVCVHPDWQKQGLADQLLNRVAEEVGSQVRMSGKGPEFKLMVRVLKEVNEKYWLRKGFKPVGEKFFEPGLFGTKTGFHIMDLSRDYTAS
ncbi:MAG: hypothetical protein Q9201_004811 [Fulgogasparrea decipioides]